jgi:dimethylhistidine N-methyltransferase
MDTMNTPLAANGITQHAFKQDVMQGLSQAQKSIPCKWFYDETGSALFEAITHTAEYYLTRVETRLLQRVAGELALIVPKLSLLIEPGSGASVKTRLLLSSQPHLKTYVPIDISAAFLNEIAQRLHADYPDIHTIPLVGDFTDMHAPLDLDSHEVRMVFFPGSTIGNFSPDKATALLKNFHYLAGNQGWLLIGVDSTQNATQLLAAYNDAAGVTAQFNKNLLLRANTELNTDFVLDQFTHEARFNKDDSRIEMHLVSRIAQSVRLDQQAFNFAADESIFTESCYKYSRNHFLAMAHACNWTMQQVWQDQEESAFELFLLKSTV